MLRKIIKFSADFCGPCKLISPVIKEICSERGIMLEEVDVEEHGDYAESYNVTKVPTVVFMKENGDKHMIIGAKQKEEYIKELDMFLADV